MKIWFWIRSFRLKENKEGIKGGEEVKEVKGKWEITLTNGECLCEPGYDFLEYSSDYVKISKNIHTMIEKTQGHFWWKKVIKEKTFERELRLLLPLSSIKFIQRKDAEVLK